MLSGQQQQGGPLYRGPNPIALQGSKCVRPVLLHVGGAPHTQRCGWWVRAQAFDPEAMRLHLQSHGTARPGVPAHPSQSAAFQGASGRQRVPTPTDTPRALPTVARPPNHWGGMPEWNCHQTPNAPKAHNPHIWHSMPDPLATEQEGQGPAPSALGVHHCSQRPVVPSCAHCSPVSGPTPPVAVPRGGRKVDM